jgi:signal transduction histidine kinase
VRPRLFAPGYRFFGKDLPKDVSLSLFRGTQEALHNAVTYSGVSQFFIELSGIEDVVRLVVSDAGAGFDVGEAKKKPDRVC